MGVIRGFDPRVHPSFAITNCVVGYGSSAKEMDARVKPAHNDLIRTGGNALKHRAPGSRHQAVAGPVLLDLTQTREREMEPDDLRLLGRGHVVEFVTCARR